MVPIGITMGCPAGIGPEIILKYFARYHCSPPHPVVVLGDREVLQKQADHFGLSLAFSCWRPGELPPVRSVPVLSLSTLDWQELRWGCPTRETGKAMASYIEAGVSLFQQGKLSGITTCPISKTSLNRAGYGYPGHTEMIAALLGEKRFTMMMAGSSLRVTLVTIHCSFAAVLTHLTAENVFDRICITSASLIGDFGIAHPRIAVAGLNPHGGEDGTFGDEETGIILPAIRKARDAGIAVEGPFPPDTVFLSAVNNMYDAVVCMYHDQGLIPFKLLHFDDGVNVTIGLSIVRTSVDHGTAYDIAGKGTASEKSLDAAVAMADEMVRNRGKLS